MVLRQRWLYLRDCIGKIVGTLHDGHVMGKRFVWLEVHLTPMSCIKGMINNISIK